MNEKNPKENPRSEELGIFHIFMKCSQMKFFIRKSRLRISYVWESSCRSGTLTQAQTPSAMTSALVFFSFSNNFIVAECVLTHVTTYNQNCFTLNIGRWKSERFDTGEIGIGIDVCVNVLCISNIRKAKRHLYIGNKHVN